MTLEAGVEVIVRAMGVVRVAERGTAALATAGSRLNMMAIGYRW